MFLLLFYLSFCGSIYGSPFPASKRSWGFSGSMGVPICADRWSLRRPVREGKDMGKAWEKMDAFSSFYLSTSIAMGKQLRQLGFPVPTNPKTETRVAWLHLSAQRFLMVPMVPQSPSQKYTVVRWFSQPKNPIFFRDLQVFISFPCYVCWLTTPVN